MKSTRGKGKVSVTMCIYVPDIDRDNIANNRQAQSRDEPRLELGVHVFGIILEFAPSSIFFYLEMKVEVALKANFSQP